MDNDTKAMIIAKGLAYTENGGAPNIENLQAGGSGEMKSIFQFTPATWKNYAKAVKGDENLPLTNENEAEVVHGKVMEWLGKGYTEKQIASMWNAGTGRPNAYKENWKGVNKHGVKYDTPAYVDKFTKYYDQIAKEGVGDFGGSAKPMNQIAQTPPVRGGVMAPNNIGSLVQLATSNLKAPRNPEV